MKFRWHYLLYITGFIVLLILLGELNDYFDSKQRATFKDSRLRETFLYL
ncbi:hypothetical protein [Bacillus sp. NTK071]|nr:hypothetical protein [Bacillus sp. NTK071]